MGRSSNADRNGTINIAAHLIMLTPLLHEVRGLGKWVDAIQQVGKRSRLKAQQKIDSSKGKSLLSKRGTASGPGESAAIHHAQMSLPDFGDDFKMGDEDLAVVKIVGTLTVAGSDEPVERQEKEARSSGGIPSR